MNESCSKCRREGTKLFLKGEKCVSSKCPFVRRNYPPGQSGVSKGSTSKRGLKLSDYGVELREKQKVKRIYGLRERQFRNYFKKAGAKKEITGEALLQLLELRLDNIVYRLGLANSRELARQLIRHGHVSVNERKVDIPSYQVKTQDKIGVLPSSEGNKYFKEILPQRLKEVKIPSWLSFDSKKLEGRVLNIPTREDLDTSIQEQLIVEYYSKK